MVRRVAALTHFRIHSSSRESSSGIHLASLGDEPGHLPGVCAGAPHLEQGGSRCSLRGDACMLATMDTQYAMRLATIAVSGRTGR